MRRGLAANGAGQRAPVCSAPPDPHPTTEATRKHCVCIPTGEHDLSEDNRRLGSLDEGETQESGGGCRRTENGSHRLGYPCGPALLAKKRRRGDSDGQGGSLALVLVWAAAEEHSIKQELNGGGIVKCPAPARSDHAAVSSKHTSAKNQLGPARPEGVPRCGWVLETSLTGGLLAGGALRAIT
ncbi:hypothetical protein NDU88_006250 [Pleurodeles waltl]|uniref:Uncharacterized protein n=1 Tax=Pleurodeles waltl TaxID=8319 RepID=A0AAV7N1T3_PLEWA|nr:hypothetical protein NDU88_006250 [Pleurodeles waltl]